MTSFVTRSPAETFALGQSFATSLVPGDVVALVGNLGSGKTQFASGVCSGLGVRAGASSPTFTLINEYEANGGRVVHADLYRIVAKSELAELGLEEYFTSRYVCLIEWAERALELLPERYQLVKIEFGENEKDRHLTISQVGSMLPETGRSGGR